MKPMGKIPEVTDEIERDFLDTAYEVYETFFTKKVQYFALDEEPSNINTYGETDSKVYKAPVELIAKVIIYPQDGEKAINRDYNTAVFRVPTQSMWENGLATDSKSLAKMVKGKFSWNGIDYQVERIRPKSMINDSFLFHEFSCQEIILETDYREGGGDYYG